MNTKFNTLLNDEKILQAISKIGLITPTEIQEKAIPLILNGKNIIAQSATGTGKTIAFLSAILSMIDNTKKIQCLIIVPTRELANQILEETLKIGKIKEINACAIYGGTSYTEQIKLLRRANVVIGTPGRLLDLIEKNRLSLKEIKWLVLDEADRMCDMGFYDDMEIIIKQLPKEKQTLLFSATITNDVSKLERNFLSDAQKIKIETKIDPKNLLQEYYIVKSNQKFAILLYLIKQHNKKTIIFCNTRNEVDVLYTNFKEQRVECFKLHGGLDQKKRTSTIEKYHASKNTVLISSDVAARGIHIDNLDYIYNYDLPKDNNQYIHRIGRTARAGKKGKAIAIILQKEEEDFLKMCKKFGYIVEFKQQPPFAQIAIKRTTVKKETEDTSIKNRFQERKKHFDKPLKKRKEENYKKKINSDFTSEEQKKQKQDYFKHKKKIKQKKYFKKR